MSGGRTVKIDILGDAKSAQGAFAAVEQSAGGLSGVLQGAGKGIAIAAGVAGAALLTAGIAGTKMAADTMAAQGKLQAQLGLTAAEAEQLGDVAQAVFAGNFGDSVSGVMQDIALLRQNIGDLSPELTQQATEAAYTLRDVFGAEVNETTRTVGVMLKNFEGLSATDAFDIMTVGFQQGANYSDELLDTLREYSPQFAALGMSADQMMSTLIAGADAGAWNLDKVGDAIKELTIRSQDMSSSTAEGFKLAGLNATEMGNAFAAGGESAQGALVATLAALAQIEDPIKRNAAGIALFGTTWEDLEDDVVLAMANGQAGLEGFQGATERAADAAGNNLGAALETLKRTGMVLLSDAMMPLVGVLTTIAQFATTQMPRVQSVMESAFGAVGDVVDDVLPTLKSLVNFFGMVVEEGDVLNDHLGELPGILQPVALVLGTVTELVLSLARALRDGDWSGIVDAFAQAWDNVTLIDWAGIAETIWDELSDALGDAVDFGAGLGEWIADTVWNADWAGIGGTVWSAILGGVMAAEDWGGDFASWFGGVVTNAPWSDYLSETWTAILSGITQAADWAETFASWFAETVTGITWGDYLSDVWGAILNGITQAADWGGTFAAWFADIATNADWVGTASAIWDAIKTAWFAVTGWGGELVAWVQSALSGVDWSGAATAIRDGIVNAASSVDWSAIGQKINESIQPPEDGGGKWAAFIAGLSLLFGGLIGPITSIASSIGGITQNLAEAFGNPEVQSQLAEFSEHFRTIATVVGGAMFVAFQGIMAPIRGILDVLALMSGAFRVLSEGATPVLIGILNAVNELFDAIGSLVRGVSALFRGDWSEAWAGAKDAVASLVDGILNLFEGLLLGVVAIVDSLTGGTVSRLWEWASNALSAAGEFVGNILGALLRLPSEAPGIVSGFVSSVQGFLSDLVGEGTRLAGELVTGVIGKLGEMVSQAYTKASQLYADVVFWIGEVVSDATEKAASLPGAITSAVGDLGGILVEQGKAFVQGLIDGIDQMLGPLDEWVGKIGSLLGKIDIPGRSPVDHAGLEIGSEYVAHIAMGIARTIPQLDDSVARIGQAMGSVGVAIRDREPDLQSAGHRVPRAVADGIVSEEPIIAQAAQSIADILLRDVNDSINAAHDGLHASAAQVAKAIADGLTAGSDAAVAAAASMSDGVAVELDKLRQQLAVDLDLARIVGDADDIKKLEEQFAKVNAALGGWADGLGVTVTEALDAAQVADKMAAKWDELLEMMPEILSGEAASEINAKLRDIQAQIQWAEMLGVPQEQIDLLKAQQAQLQEDLAAVGAAYSQAMQNGMVAAWTPAQAATMADEIGAILDGTLAKNLKADLDKINKTIAAGQAMGLDKALIDEWQKQADDTAARLAEVNADMATAAAAGLLSPDALAAYNQAMGVITQIPVDKWREALAIMGDAWPSMLDDLAADIASGAMTIDDAMSVLPAMTKEQADAVEEELRRLEAQFREELAQAVLTGTEEAKAAAAANLQAIIDMLAATGAAAKQTGTDVNAALTSLFAPSNGGEGASGGGGGGGSSISRPGNGRGADAYAGIAGDGSLNLHPQWGQQAPRVNVYIGNEQVAAVVETEMLSSVDGALLGEAS